MSTPCGPRFAAAQEYNAQKARAKEEYDDWQRPNKPAFPETLTSIEHPLRTAANDASALPFYTTRGIPAHYTDVQVPAGKRTYPRDERYGTTSHLDATLSPRTGTELLAARHEANILRSSVTAQAAQVAEALAQLRAQGTAAGGVGLRPRSAQPLVEGSTASPACMNTAATRDLRHLPGPALLTADYAESDASGSSNGAWSQHSPRLASQLSPGSPSAALWSTFPNRDRELQQQQRHAATQQVALEVEEQQALAAELLRQYPHGIPKWLMLKLQRERPGLQLPGLGYGMLPSR